MSSAQTIEHAIAVKILRGELAPGTALPPVRTLAASHGVTAPTIQRVVDRLQTAGLVTARRGSGVRVNDPRERIDLALLPLWFEALHDQPARAASILADFLELRRVVAAHLVRTALPRIVAAAPALIELARLASEASDVGEVALADRALTRGIVDAAGHFAVSAIFSVTERLVANVPHVAEAVYGDRRAHRRALGEVASLLAADACAQDIARRLDEALAPWDRRSVKRFEALLR